MRQVVIWLSLIGSLIVFALTIDFFSTATMFLLFGILPDTTTRLSADQMLSMYTVASGAVALLLMRSRIVVAFRSLKSLRIPQPAQNLSSTRRAKA